MKFYFTFATLALCAAFSTAQGPPGFDVFVAPLKVEGNKVTVGTPENVTARAGYDNQPHFLPDGSLLFSSIQDGAQSDIYKRKPDGKIVPFTQTAESEYSPILMPDGKSISVVQVEADNTQRIWAFPLAGGDPRVVLDQVKGVGYYTWLNDKQLAMFIVGDPMKLIIAATDDQTPKVIEGQIGRSLHKVPKQNAFSFVEKLSESDWQIKKYHLEDGAIETLTATRPGVEDLTWTPDGTILMAEGSVLYKLKPGVDNEWVQVADFSSAGLKGMNRMAVSPDGSQLAIVAADAP